MSTRPEGFWTWIKSCYEVWDVLNKKNISRGADIIDSMCAMKKKVNGDDGA